MFTPVATRIEDILNAPSQFAIPVYQRDYKWGKEEALELVEDLRSYPPSNPENLFLGNLIFEKTKDQKTFVVDGQQRLTTILLLLVACRVHSKTLGSPELAQTIQSKITFIDSTTAESRGVRLIASDSIRDVFEYVTHASWDGSFPSFLKGKSVKKQTNRLKPTYDYFLQQISPFDRPALSSFLRSLYNAYVVRIDIENEVDALTIFERTNARGLDLEASDLLKNYLFSRKVDGIEDLWTQILDASAGTILRMLKYFSVAKNGYVPKAQLYKRLKTYGTAVGPQQLTQELADFSRFYRVVGDADEAKTREFFQELGCTDIHGTEYRYQRINAALQALREFRIVQFCPPAYAAVERFATDGTNGSPQGAKALVRLFETFERYHFINNVICERIGSEVEKLYADSCIAYTNTADFVKTTNDLIGALTGRLASEDEFVAQFTDLSYAPDEIPLLCYIFDRLNNYGLDPGQHLRIYNPNSKLIRRNHNIEHFLPQNPEAGFEVSRDTLASVDNIGNLLLIYFRTNSRLGNASPAKKVERLKGDLSREVQNSVYITEFVDKYAAHAPSWDKTRIQQRAKDMAVHAYREVWKIR